MVAPHTQCQNDQTFEVTVGINLPFSKLNFCFLNFLIIFLNNFQFLPHSTSYAEDLSKTPGPARYGATENNNYLKRQPQESGLG